MCPAIPVKLAVVRSEVLLLALDDELEGVSSITGGRNSRGDR